MRTILYLQLFICLLLGSNARAQYAEPSSAAASLREILLTQGLLIDASNRKLPPPSLDASQTSAQKKTKLEELAGRLGWDKFSRESIYAPVMIDLSYLKNEKGQRVGHDIHTAFIAHAPLANLRDDQFLKAVFGSESEKDDRGFQVKDLPDSALQTLGIDPRAEDGQKFATVQLPLLNRVELHGTIRIQKFEGENWIEFFWQIDPRFTKSEKQSVDSRFENSWVKLERDERGAPVAGTPQPYQGCGGFLSVWKVGSEDEDMLLIESRMLMYEPQDWFAGSNFLRSKLPPALQENARSFRRQLSRETE